MISNNQTHPQKIGIAIAGLGFGEKVHLPAILSNDIFNPIAIYHPSQEKIKEKSNTHNLIGYSNWNNLLNNKDINAIVIATPPGARFDLAIKALESGKHLLLEKPVALNSDQIKALQVVAIKNRLSVAVNFEYRSVPLFIQTKRILEREIIGKPWLIKFDWLMSSRFNTNRPWNWYSDINQGGGVIGALGTHAFDILHWLIGPTVSLNSMLSTSVNSRIDPNTKKLIKVTSEDSCLTQLKLFDINHKITVPTQVALSSVASKGRGCWIEIYGSKGKLLLGSDNQSDYVHGFGLWISKKGDNTKLVRPDSDLIFNKNWEDGRIAPVAQIQSLWAQSITSGLPIIPGLSEAFLSQRVCDLVKESALSEMNVSINSFPL